MPQQTMMSKDPYFGPVFIDVDEWRDKPVRHRYVHGGFKDTQTLFSMYFPPENLYEGRFFQHVLAWAGTEKAFSPDSGMLGMGATMGMEFAFASGGYFIESNQGRTAWVVDGKVPGSVQGYRASAQAARHSRQLAAEMYGPHRPYGYIYGGSGGGYRTIGCFENTVDVWDGAVPFVHGHPMTLPNFLFAYNHGVRLLRHRAAQITDAVDPGGSGDMYAGLSVGEREALALMTRLGFPPRCFFDFDAVVHNQVGLGIRFADYVATFDPTYLEDFWSKPGYLGADAPESLKAARVQLKTTVTGLVTVNEAVKLGLPGALPMQNYDSSVPIALRVKGLPTSPSLLGAVLLVTSGRGMGTKLYVLAVVGDIIVTGESQLSRRGLADVAVGDEVMIDNSDFLSLQTYHRHQVDPRYPQWNQFTAAEQPIYPQRSLILSDIVTRKSVGYNMSGRFAGKMIVVQTLMDELAIPGFALHYRDLVEHATGSEFSDKYRLWFIDHTMHAPAVPQAGEMRPARTTRIVDYVGAVLQALRDVVLWVEQGVAPPWNSAHKYVDGQVLIPATAQERSGIQPVVHLAANGGEAARVQVGEEVQFAALVEVPMGTGTIVRAEWDFEGDGAYPIAEAVDGSMSRLTLKRAYAFSVPGTYFPALRVSSHRHGDLDDRHGRIYNLGRVRVVVRA